MLCIHGQMTKVKNGKGGERKKKKKGGGRGLGCIQTKQLVNIF